jgi:hypothetical protein
MESERKAKLRMPGAKQLAECGRMSGRYVPLRDPIRDRERLIGAALFDLLLYDLMETEGNVAPPRAPPAWL